MSFLSSKVYKNCQDIFLELVTPVHVVRQKIAYVSLAYSLAPPSTTPMMCDRNYTK